MTEDWGYVNNGEACVKRWTPALWREGDDSGWVDAVAELKARVAG